MHQAIGTGKRKSSKRFSLLTFVLIGDAENAEMGSLSVLAVENVEIVERVGVINRVENVENVEWGPVGRPMVGAAVPCRPHGVGRGDQEIVEKGR